MSFFRLCLCLLLLSSKPFSQSLPNPALSLDLALSCLNSHSLLKELQNFSRNGILIRVILSAPDCTHPGSLVDQIPPEIQIRFLEEPFPAAEFAVVDRKTVILQPENGYDGILASPIKMDSAIAQEFQSRFLAVWKTLSPQRAQELLLALNQSMENQTLAVSEPTETPPAETGEQAPFVGSKTGRVYYRSSSPAASRIKEENRVYFQSEEEAQKAGRHRSARF